MKKECKCEHGRSFLGKVCVCCGGRWKSEVKECEYAKPTEDWEEKSLFPHQNNCSLITGQPQIIGRGTQNCTCDVENYERIAKDFIRNLLKQERDKALKNLKESKIEIANVNYHSGVEDTKQKILSMVDESIKFWHIQWEGIEDVKQRARRKEFNKEVTLLINSVLEEIKKQIETL